LSSHISKNDVFGKRSTHWISKRDDFSEWFDQKFFTTGSNLLLCDQNGEAQGVKKVGVPKESKCKVANNSPS